MADRYVWSYYNIDYFKLKRKLLISILIIAVFAETLFLVSKLVGVGKSKKAVAQKIEKLLDAKVQIKGKLDLKFFPRPKLAISHMRINDFAVGGYNVNMRIPNFEGNISIFKFLSGNISFSDITISNAKLDLLVLDSVENSNKNAIFEVPLNHFYVRDSTINLLNDKKEIHKKYDGFEGDFSFVKNITINSKFASVLNKYELKAEIVKNADVVDTNLNLLFTGNKLELKSSYDLAENKTTGEVKLAGNDFQKLIFNNLISSWFLFPDNRKFAYHSSFSFIQNDHEVVISEGVIEGDSVIGKFNGSIGENKEGIFNFNLEKIDLDAILTTRKRSFIEEEMAYLDLSENSGGLFASDREIMVSGIIDNLIVKKRKIGPVNLDLLLEKDNLKLENLNFQFGQYDNNDVMGFIKHDKDGYKFIGNVHSIGSDFKQLINIFKKDWVFLGGKSDRDFNLKSDFELAEDMINIYNLKGRIENSLLSGQVFIDTKNNSDSAINLNFNNVDFNNYFLTNKKNQIRHPLHYMYENMASRENGFSLLQRFLWLRNIFSKVKYELNFSNILYNGYYIDNVDVIGELKHRFLSIDRFSIKSNENDINSSAIITLDENQPHVKVDVDAAKANLSFLDYQEGYRSANKSWSKDLIVFPNFENIDFTFDASFNKLKYRNIFSHDSKWEFEVKNNILDIKEATGFIDQGKFKIDGNFIMDGLPTLAITYNFEQFQIGDFIELFFGIKEFKAKSNFAGSLTAYGNTPYIMIKQLKAKNKFFVADIEIDKFAVGKINQEIANLSLNPHNAFQKPVEEVIRDGTTKLKSSSGELNVQNGVMVLNNIKFSIPNLESVSAGKIDLISKKMQINSIVSFITQYKVKGKIKKSNLQFSHELAGDLGEVEGKYDVFQLKSFVGNLKKMYIKAYEQMKQGKK